ncbi:MAG: TIM barrel protein [Candidatus Atribacteria bacterium]|nr:TIM barrel protein [Candidatus Atribacteria bacterium]
MEIRENVKFSVGIWAFTACGDRFSPLGYREGLTLEDQFALLSRVEGVQGVILQCPNVVNEHNIEQVKLLLQQTNLEAAAVDANLFSGQYVKGSFTNPNPVIRQEAVRLAKQTVNMAKALGTKNAGLWLGQDGYDYPFQANHLELWKWEMDAIREVAEYDPSVRLCIEYKVKEPRYHLVIGDVGKALLACQEVGQSNVGITFDFGHAFMCNENPAESVRLLQKYGKLFSVHFNDSYRVDDDDMIAGSVHSWETLEVLLALEEMKYDGWYGFDIFPYREDMVGATTLCVQNIKSIRKLLKKIDFAALKKLQGSLDFIEIHRMLRGIFYPD